MVMGMFVACWTMIFMITNFDSLTMWNKIIMVLVLLVALFYAVVKECIMQSKVEDLEHKVNYFKNKIQKILSKNVSQPYFTPEQVRRMTPEEVRKNCTAITKSMEKWN